MSISGITDAAEEEGSPLGELVARIMRGEANGDDLAEFGGRQCYRSWAKGRPSDTYHDNIIEQGHGSIYEHSSMTFQIVGVSRALTHELIRHRVGTAYSQESQRYVPAKDINFVVPPTTAYHLQGKSPEEIEADEELAVWRNSCERALDDYGAYLARLEERLKREPCPDAIVSIKKRALEAARSVLPNATETRMLMTMNLRSFRHVSTLRGGEAADLEIRRLACMMLDHARDYAPHFFKAVEHDIGADGIAIIRSRNGKV